jgi:hypothetical protein
MAIRLLVLVSQGPRHAEAIGHVQAEGRRELLAVEAQAGRGELHAHEEAPALGIRRVLVGGDDVGPWRNRKLDTAATIPGLSGQK